EISVTVDDFEKTVAIFEAIGCPRRGLQESRRELWNFRGVEVMIDEWPGLEPYVEIEGPTERAVVDASEALGFDYSQAVFGSAGKVYLLRYGMSAEEVAEKYGAIAFSNEKLKELQRNTPLK
ncbi:MAG: hypothetical protein P4L81_03940, partial [Candidatus Pacebacteria bacterium]|nr:hypothetical protein [Candidatus Paceibacterota bacterium]